MPGTLSGIRDHTSTLNGTSSASTNLECQGRRGPTQGNVQGAAGGIISAAVVGNAIDTDFGRCGRPIVYHQFNLAGSRLTGEVTLALQGNTKGLAALLG